MLTDEIRSIFDFRAEQDRIEIQKFVLYWTETDGKGKQRWQKEKTFELLKRLRRWKLNIDTRRIENKQKTMRGFSLAEEETNVSLNPC